MAPIQVVRRLNRVAMENEEERKLTVPKSSGFSLRSVQLLSSVAQSCLTLCNLMDFNTPGLPVHPNSLSLLKLTSITLVMPSNHLILCHPLLFPPSIFPSIGVFANESALCDPMNCSTPGLPGHHHLPEFAQTHVHRVSDAIQPSHPQSSPSPPALNPSQHQSLFQ